MLHLRHVVRFLKLTLFELDLTCHEDLKGRDVFQTFCKEYLLNSHLTEGTAVIQRMRELQTPLHDVTFGSEVKERTHTCPTNPSELQTQTSLVGGMVADAQVNCMPARVFRIGSGNKNSGGGLLSISCDSRCFASTRAVSKDALFSVDGNMMVKLSTPSLLKGEKLLNRFSYMIEGVAQFST